MNVARLSLFENLSYKASEVLLILFLWLLLSLFLFRLSLIGDRLFRLLLCLVGYIVHVEGDKVILTTTTFDLAIAPFSFLEVAGPFHESCIWLLGCPLFAAI